MKNTPSQSRQPPILPVASLIVVILRIHHLIHQDKTICQKCYARLHPRVVNCSCLLIQITGHNRFVEFGHFQTNGVSIFVHAIIYFALICIFLLAWYPYVYGLIDDGGVRRLFVV
ncbi:hypothetical protein ACS0TY_001838 [Phlomoides rotata]